MKTATGGRTRSAVKTTEPNRVTVRGRRWVMVPKRGTAGHGRRRRGGLADRHRRRDGDSPARVDAPAPGGQCQSKSRPSPMRSIAAATTRSQKALDAVDGSRATSSARFRSTDSPWPNDPQRTAVFALEMALAGLRSDNAYARDEGGRLLGRVPRARSSAGRRRRVRMLVVLHRSRGARRALHAGERAPVHPARAAALPRQRAAAPRLRVRLRTAVAARQA